MVQRVEHLGTWLGHVTFDDQFAKPLRAFRDKTAFIATLPPTLAQKVEILRVWAFPILFYVATLFYPTNVMRRQLDASMRWALGVKPWSFPVAQMMQSKDKGGGVVADVRFGLCIVGTLTSVRGVSPKTGARPCSLVGGDETGHDPAQENPGYRVPAVAHMLAPQAQAGHADVNDVRGSVLTFWQGHARFTDSTELCETHSTMVLQGVFDGPR